MSIFSKKSPELQAERRLTRLEAEVDDEITIFFEQNYEFLSLSSGRGLTNDTKEAAYKQVLLYWLKLKEIAKRVTETEVRLILPNQRTPRGRLFTIEGVVDIVREFGTTTMYDIKTHAVEDVLANRAFYEEQLNVYAYIWQELRRQQLDQTAVIATSYPQSLRNAILSEDDGEIGIELERWNPLVDIPFSQEQVDQTIWKFGEVIDKIEEGRFRPPAQEVLRQRDNNQQQFATRVCRNCDGRFSCDAYLTFFKSQTNNRPDSIFQLFLQSQTASDLEQDVWINQNQPGDDFSSVLDD
jgi:hypothetical protein